MMAMTDKKVLVTDDNAALRGLLRVSLQAFGFSKVIEATDGERALETLRAEPVDLLVTDWKMKPMDGVELVRALRDRATSPAPYLPIIVLTAYADADKASQARDAGADEFLVKPFTAEALARSIRSVLDPARSFITDSNYFGPDRRRSTAASRDGTDRRLVTQH
jgi:CheY-like chemotaxis protein